LVADSNFRDSQHLAAAVAVTGVLNGAVQLEVDTAAVFFAGVKNCTDSVHKVSWAFLLCYESVQFLTPAKQLAAV
jgi:hypothetical protein